LDPVSQPEYMNLEQHYLITDDLGNITNVTEGLNLELGLNAKFFNYSDSIFQQIHEPDYVELMEAEGHKMTIDTRNILANIDLEQLSAEEILEVKSNLGQTEVFIQRKKMVLDPRFCTINVYRIMIIPDY
jgi:hypothetical protein